MDAGVCLVHAPARDRSRVGHIHMGCCPLWERMCAVKRGALLLLLLLLLLLWPGP